MEVKELRGVAANDLEGALLEMDAVASGTRCGKPFYHASINTRAEERMTGEQRMLAIDRLEQELGLTGQPRVVVVHEKEGREHCHIVWSRIDIERMTTISDSHNYRKHELVAREMERQFGHERVQGAHVEREGQPRPERTPGHDEMQQAARGGVTPKEARRQLTDAWQRTDSGHEFRSAIEEEGWVLARGDRREFVAVDHAGATHSLARRIEGAKAQDVRERFADLDPATLPRVEEARALQVERQAAPREQTAAGRASAGEREAVAAFASPREPEAPTAAPEAPRTAPEALAPAIDSRAGQAAGRTATAGLFMAADAASEATEKLADFVSGLFESGAAPPPPRHYRAAELAQDPAARRDHYAQQAAERAGIEALDRIRLDMEAGKGLSRADVGNLPHGHLLQIRHHGDDYLRQAVADLERDRGRSGGIERERER